jgi:hypothetical protein
VHCGLDDVRAITMGRPSEGRARRAWRGGGDRDGRSDEGGRGVRPPGAWYANDRPRVHAERRGCLGGHHGARRLLDDMNGATASYEAQNREPYQAHSHFTPP